MPRLDWIGAAIFVLASGLAVGFAGSLVILSVSDDPASDSAAQLLTLLGGGMIAIVSGYLARYGGPSRAAPDATEEKP